MSWRGCSRSVDLGRCLYQLIRPFAVCSGVAASLTPTESQVVRDQLLGEVEEVNPAPGVWEFQIVPSGWLQLFESEINEPNQSVMRFESHDIEASRMLASSLSTNVDQIETVPEAVRYFEFGDPFGNRLSFYELLA